MDEKEYFEFGQSLHKIRENLEWRRDNLKKSLKDFESTKSLTSEQYMDRGLSASFSYHDFIDVACYPDSSEGPVLNCTFQDLDGNYIKRVSSTMMDSGKKRILKVYSFAFELLEEQIAEVEAELKKLDELKNA